MKFRPDCDQTRAWFSPFTRQLPVPINRPSADQASAQERAVDSARRAADLATDRYRSGIVAYISVVDASREALATERTNAQLAGQRLIAAVQLIKALGGGWTVAPLYAHAATPASISRNQN